MNYSYLNLYDCFLFYVELLDFPTKLDEKFMQIMTEFLSYL